MSKNKKNFQELVQAPSISNYQQKPVENYGMSLLKSMGFTEQRGIGFHKQNALNQPLVLKPRPKGLGLGAKPQDSFDLKAQFSKQEYVLIKSQTHKGMIGIIKKVKKQQQCLTVELGISGTQIKIKFNEVDKITETEYRSLKEKISQQKKQRNEEDNERKKRRLKWVIPNIRCKVIDKLSQYYLKKVVISELINERQFQCIFISDSGQKKYLKQLTQKQLQTVLPKIQGLVLLLDKKYIGQKAKIVERNKEKGEVVVQILETLEIQSFGEDSISQYVQI